MPLLFHPFIWIVPSGFKGHLEGGADMMLRILTQGLDVFEVKVPAISSSKHRVPTPFCHSVGAHPNSRLSGSNSRKRKVAGWFACESREPRVFRGYLRPRKGIPTSREIGEIGSERTTSSFDTLISRNLERSGNARMSQFQTFELTARCLSSLERLPNANMLL